MDTESQWKYPSKNEQGLLTMFPKLTTMQQPMTRGEFEERINLTFEQIETGKQHPNGLDGLLDVRHLPNGRIDMLSVNETVRLHSNMSHQMIATPMGDMLRKMAGQGGSNSENEL
jgi:hypothetical protein